MAVGKKSKSQEAYASRYKATTFALNRRKKLERVLKDQPENEQVKMALKDIHYRRKTPNTTAWLPSAKRAATLIAEFEKAANVLANTKQDDTKASVYKNMFSIQARLQNGVN